MKRLLKAVIVNLVNQLSNLLPDDKYSGRLRPIMYKAIGFKSGHGTSMKGGSRVNGYGLRTGARVFINRECYFDLSASVSLGDDVVVGHHVTFVTAAHEIGPPARRAGRVSPAPINVENGAWIGCRATILPGVTIGHGAIVGAGSIVTRSVDPHTIVAGIPAKPVRSLALGELEDA